MRSWGRRTWNTSRRWLFAAAVVAGAGGVACSSGGSTTTGGFDGGGLGSVVDAGDDGGSANPNAIDIRVLRDPSAAERPAYESYVEVERLVVTTVKSTGTGRNGFFAQNEGATDWGGINVYLGAAPVEVQRGDVVSVGGLFRTFKGLDQVHADRVTKTGTVQVPEARAVTLSEVSNGDARLHGLEVVVSNVVLLPDVNSVYDVSVADEADRTKTLWVTSYVANDATAPFSFAADTRFQAITGVAFFWDIPKLAPADEAAFEALP